MTNNDRTFQINLKKLPNQQIPHRRTQTIRKKKIETLNVKIVKVTPKNKQTEIPLTNLPNEIASPQELKELYNTRRTIENSLRPIKKTNYN